MDPSEPEPLSPGTGLTFSDMEHSCATPFHVGLFMDVVAEPEGDAPSACRQQAVDGEGFVLHPFGGGGAGEALLQVRSRNKEGKRPAGLLQFK